MAKFVLKNKPKKKSKRWVTMAKKVSGKEK